MPEVSLQIAFRYDSTMKGKTAEGGRAFPARLVLFASVFLVFAALLPAVRIPIHAPDSGSYIHLARRIADDGLEGYAFTRTPGYPLLISLVSFNERLLVLLQASLTLASILSLYALARRELRGMLQVSACVLLHTMNLTVWSYSFSVLTDSVASALILISFTLMVFHLHTPGPRFFLPAIVLSTYSALVRPALVTVPFVFLAVCLFRKGTRRYFWIGAPISGLLLASWAFTVQRHTGVFALTTLMPVNLTNHTGAFLEHADEEFAPMRDAYLAVRDSLSRHEMAIFQAQRRMRALYPDLPASDYNRLLLRMSLSAIYRQPLLYLRSGARSLVWNHIPANPHQPFLEQLGGSAFLSFLSRRAIRATLILLTLAAYLHWFGRMFRRRFRLDPAEALPLLVILAYSVPVALLETPNGRYMMPFYGLFALYGIKSLTRLRNRLLTRRPAPGILASWQGDDAWPEALMEGSGNREDFQADLRKSEGTLRVFSRPVALRKESSFWFTDPVREMVHPGNRPLFPASDYKEDLKPDPVVLWEMSRLTILPPLARCARAGDRDAMDLLTRTLAHWSRENSSSYGLAWRVPQEAAIRSLSLLPAALWCTGVPQSMAKDLLGRCVLQLVETTLQGRTPPNNHLLVELTALALMLPLYPALGKRYHSRVLEELFRHSRRQFHPDGHHVECSTGYHALALEALKVFLGAVPLSWELQKPLVHFEKDMEALEQLALRAREVTGLYMCAYGRSPNFGDSSDSRIFPGFAYYRNSLQDHGHLLAPFRPEPPEGLRVFPDSGYGYFRSSLYGACMNSSVPGDQSGHSHEDKGSFVLQVRERPVFVDPGTWMYNCPGDKRRYYRSALNHNVLTVDGMEQSARDLASGFTRMEGVRTGIEASGDREITLWHDGYARLDGVGRVFRSLRFLDDGVQVTERVEGSGRHDIAIGYVLHPDVVLDAEALEISSPKEQFRVRIVLTEKAAVEVAAGFYSGCYGQEEHTLRLILRYPGVRLPFMNTYRLKIIAEQEQGASSFRWNGCR